MAGHPRPHWNKETIAGQVAVNPERPCRNGDAMVILSMRVGTVRADPRRRLSVDLLSESVSVLGDSSTVAQLMGRRCCSDEWVHVIVGDQVKN